MCKQSRMFQALLPQATSLGCSSRLQMFFLSPSWYHHSTVTVLAIVYLLSALPSFSLQYVLPHLFLPVCFFFVLPQHYYSSKMLNVKICFQNSIQKVLLLVCTDCVNMHIYYTGCLAVQKNFETEFHQTAGRPNVCNCTNLPPNYFPFVAA